MRCTRPIPCYVLNEIGRKHQPEFVEHPLPTVVFGTEPPHHRYTFYRSIMVPCGKCYGCLLDRREAWTVRSCLEMLDWEKNCFVTLTYADEHLPLSDSFQPTLYRPHFTDFLKRFRYHVEPTKIRYFGCGEYGSKFDRPHYHAIIYNWCPDDLVIWKVGATDELNTYISKTLQDLWPFGFVTVSPASFRTCKYVSGYVGKKIFGKPIEGVEPCFTACSLKPAIGKRWFERNGHSLVKFSVAPDGDFEISDHKVRISNGESFESFGIPQTFLRWWRDSFPDKHELLLCCNEHSALMQTDRDVLKAREALHKHIFEKSRLKGVLNV